MYNKVVTVLNLNTGGLLFDGGYEFVIYNGIPYVIDRDSTNPFDYERTEVIPVTAEYEQETPSVNASDRSDYTLQYQIMFRLKNLEDAKTALNEFRTYFFTNKQFTLDGYTVAIKTVRGNKQSSFMTEGGNVYARYKIDIYLTAIKYGYIVKDTDIVKMRKSDTTTAGSFVTGRTYEIITIGTTDFTAIGASANTIGVEFTATGVGSGTGTVKDVYKTLKLVEDNTGTQGNPIFSNATDTGKGHLTATTIASKLQVIYESDYFTKHLMSACMNKEDKDQEYEITFTIDGVDFDYDAYISGSSRTIRVGGVLYMLVDWIEVDG